MDEIRKETLTTRKRWSAPTTEEVQLLWSIASWKFGIPVYELHQRIGVSDRTARRWRSVANSREDGTSPIKYPNWVILVALVTGKCILEKSQFKPVIDSGLIMKPSNYNPPPLDITVGFLGSDSVTALTRSELGSIIGVHPDLLSKSAAKMPFHLWTAILLHLRVPVSQVLDVTDEQFKCCGMLEFSPEKLKCSYKKLLDAVK
ncbi:hypothetical protein JFQ72_004410 [Vibrio parahaemolyticus]|nr:hypothetical protein [Vibrio parahaemolyticus]